MRKFGSRQATSLRRWSIRAKTIAQRSLRLKTQRISTLSTPLPHQPQISSHSRCIFATRRQARWNALANKNWSSTWARIRLLLCLQSPSSTITRLSSLKGLWPTAWPGSRRWKLTVSSEASQSKGRFLSSNTRSRSRTASCKSWQLINSFLCWIWIRRLWTSSNSLKTAAT